MSCYLTTLTLTLICKRPGNTCATFQFQKQNTWTYNLNSFLNQNFLLLFTNLMSVIWASQVGTTCRLGMPAKPLSNKYRLLHSWTLIYLQRPQYLPLRSLLCLLVQLLTLTRDSMLLRLPVSRLRRQNKPQQRQPSFRKCEDLNQGWSLPNMWSIRW